jgi:hypothetical protein
VRGRPHGTSGAQLDDRLHQPIALQSLGDLIEQFVLAPSAGRHQGMGHDHQVGVVETVQTPADYLLANDRCRRAGLSSISAGQR